MAQPGGALVWSHYPARDPVGFVQTVRELIARIEQSVAHYNTAAHPFRWTATPKRLNHCTMDEGVNEISENMPFHIIASRGL